jgi:hypothetical protein
LSYPGTSEKVLNCPIKPCFYRDFFVLAAPKASIGSLEKAVLYLVLSRFNFSEVAPKMALTDTQIRQLKPQDKDVWLTDEKGLRLLLKSNGAKYWRIK